jgi:hypothetical protein
MPENRYVRTLRRATELAGGEEKLAAVLRTSPEVLRLWLSGALAPPLKKYLAALELVTQATQKRQPNR